MSDITNIAVSAGNVVPVDTLGGQVTVKVNSGGPVYYADNAQVSSANNQGNITAGNSTTFSAPKFITGAAGVQASVTLTLFAGSSTAPAGAQDVVLGSDGTVGGAGGTPLTTLDNVPAAVADVSLHSHKLTAVADAAAATDGLNRQSGDARYAPIASPTFTGTATGVSLQLAKATPTYSTSITPDASAGPWQTITVTDGTAFAVNAPTNPPSSSRTTELTIEVLNSIGGGGTVGVITWNAAFIFSTGAWTNPADTKKRFARFEWNGLKWVCTSLASADY